MTSFDRITILLILGTAVGWILWDVVLGLKHETTESAWIARWAREWNVVPFIVGTLVGHWFVQNPNPHYDRWPIALSAFVAVLAWDIFFRAGVPPWTRYPGLWLVLGIPAGFGLWPQRLP